MDFVQKIEAIKTDKESFLANWAELKITNDQEMSDAAEALAAAKKRIKRIKALKTEYVAPLKDQVKKISSLFDGELLALEEFAEKVAQMTSAYFAEKERQRQEEERRAREAYERQKAEAEKEQARLLAEAQAKAAEEAAKKGVNVESIPVPTIEPKFVPEPPRVEVSTKTVKTAGGTISARKIWQHEVVDESLVPREYLTIDTVKINFAIKSGVREIPGVKVFEKTITTTRV